MRADADEPTLSRDAGDDEGAHRFVVSVVSGPSAGLVVTLDESSPPSVLIGQSPACAIRLEDPLVSRRHASLEWDGPRLRLRDVGSTNGTFVQGVPVVEAFVRGGETVQLGDTRLRVERGEKGAAPLPMRAQFGGTLGTSEAMRRVYVLAQKLARADVPMIVEGETGTGKEVLAESIHAMGPRKDGPFVVFDCTAVAENLLESELFGHERGAFTGAVATRRGVFEQADGGTLLIDEIGDLALDLQAKLLRAIERSEIRRVGGEKWIRVDVRVVAATRRDLDLEVQKGRFRDDLFYRLAVGRVELPPLRRRTGDVSFLAHHFWTELGGQGPIPPALLERLEAHAWPGNVRELRNAVARALVMGEPERALASARAPERERDFFEWLLAERLPLPEARQRAAAELEQRYVERAVAEHGGNVTHAAAASGVGLRYFQMVRARARAAKPEEP